ncbi:hypothetical protein [Streptomyces phaeochromogenes]|uniref:hypothetical protein n=1 Tax=Streptomyces phaeochromogenes TaxID=1923 RepID=UPI002DDC7580|nr:hypothetical protein [Streptomyces phaeochromogenes]WRZ35863.1 hypothetical protein OG931_53190 [Streptomyces phaeochromogenes]
MLIAGVVAGILLIVVWVVRRSDGRYRFRPSFEAACEVTVGGRRLVAYSGHRKVIRPADPAPREDTAAGGPHGLAHLDPYAVRGRRRRQAPVGVRRPGRGRPALGSGEPRRAGGPLTGHRGWVYGLCTVRVSGRDLLASAGRDGAIRIGDPRDGRLVRTIDTGPRRGWTFALCQVRTGGRTLLAAGHGNGTVTVWHAEWAQEE